jgi:hypothetical protein
MLPAVAESDLVQYSDNGHMTERSHHTCACASAGIEY